jgi:hypothetical protein
MQTQCNYLGLWTRNVTSSISQGDSLGTWFRFTALLTNLDENVSSPKPAVDLHVNPQPDTGQNGQCETGNQGFVNGQHIGPAPGVQPDHTETTIPGGQNARVESNGGKP